jgi:hypothetical protein
VLFWIAEVILGSISTGLYQDTANWLGSITNPDNVFNIYAGVIGLVAIIAFALIGLVLIIYYFKLFRIKYRETSIDVYTRNGGLHLDEFLKIAKKEIHIFGITLEETTGSVINVIEEKLKSPHISKVRIVLYDPAVTPQMTEKLNQLVDSNIGTVQTSLERLQKSKSDLGNDGEKLEIRVFDGIPIQSVFVIDPERESDGIMRVEPYLFGIRKEDRRRHELSSKKEKNLFELYWKSYHKIWKSSHPL